MTNNFAPYMSGPISSQRRLNDVAKSLREIYTNPGDGGKNDNSDMYTMCGDLEAADNFLYKVPLPPEALQSILIYTSRAVY